MVACGEWQRWAAARAVAVVPDALVPDAVGTVDSLHAAVHDKGNAMSAHITKAGVSCRFVVERCGAITVKGP
jgi:hypothetical protein